MQFKVTRIPYRTDIEWEGNPKHFAYTLSREGKDVKIRGYYSQGEAIKGTPKVEDILYALLLDTDGISNVSFEMWCGDYGYDTDSRKALSTFELCMKEYVQLRALFSNEELQELYRIYSEC